MLASRGQELDDLVQAGAEGLVRDKGVGTLTPDRGVVFATSWHRPSKTRSAVFGMSTDAASSAAVARRERSTPNAHRGSSRAPVGRLAPSNSVADRPSVRSTPAVRAPYVGRSIGPRGLRPVRRELPRLSGRPLTLAGSLSIGEKEG